MLAADGQLKPELFPVIIRYGDQACAFLWENKGALAVGTALTAFIVAPGEFLDGTQKLTEVIAEAAVRPLAEVPKTIAAEAAKSVNWTLLSVLITFVLGGIGCIWIGQRRRASQDVSNG